MILFIILLITNVSVGDIIINTNTTKNTRFQHVWKSTGFCPPDPKENISNYLLSDEQKINIALIGSLPNKGIKHIRIHWILNLLKLAPFSLEYNRNTYDFSYMDELVLYLNKYNLMPGFEFMGSSNQNIHFEKDESFWSELVKTVIKRYIGMLGAKRVSKWRFETWNEPDLKGYDVLNFTLSEYLTYANGCSQGLREAFAATGRKWKLGGPAGLFRDKGHPLCWGLLETCNSPDSPGSIQCPVQFISFHRKGAGSSEELLNGTFQLLDSIHDMFPKLRAMPIANEMLTKYDVNPALSFWHKTMLFEYYLLDKNEDKSEADIEKNWSQSRDWRGDVRYAAMIIKVIASYYKSVRLERKLKIEVLSNDNAFLNYHPFYFTQRTLFARFQINTTSPHHNQFIKKPVYSVMALLSFLGEERLEEEATELDSLLTTVATRSKQGRRSFVSVILAYGNGSDIDRHNLKTVNVVLRDLSKCEGRFVIYRLDNVDTNPYVVWQRFGRPVFPDQYQRGKMREVEEPRRLKDPTEVNNSTLTLNLKLTLPSVHLIHLCCKPEEFPENVYSVVVVNITRGEVLVTWKYRYNFSKCLRTYEVEILSKCDSTKHFKRINPTDTIFLSFHYISRGDPACEGTRGNYRVRAVDYWDRPGKYSKIISYP